MTDGEKKEPKTSFVPEGAEEQINKEQAANELLKMSPLNRLVLAAEQIAKEANLTRLEVEKLVKVFSNVKPESGTNRQTIVIKDTTVPEPKATPEQKPEPKTQPNALVPVEEPEPQPQSTSTVEKVAKFKEALGPELAEMLTYDTDKSTNFIIVRPKKFLGTDNFKKVCAAAKDQGGDYIGAGKDSRWQIPKLV